MTDWAWSPDLYDRLEALGQTEGFEYGWYPDWTPAGVEGVEGAHGGDPPRVPAPSTPLDDFVAAGEKLVAFLTGEDIDERLLLGTDAVIAMLEGRDAA